MVSDKVCSLKHINVAAALTKLAITYQNQGKHTEAEPLLKR
ncbi:MAG: tetratricopeptide repeat protein [Actinobacteria bacterium]|nr:tetratricopeptide repeat protein [Actinomycetota bacterium]